MSGPARGRSRALRVLPTQIGSVWCFCMGAQRASQPKTVGFGPGQSESLSCSWQSNNFPSQSSTFCTFGCLILWCGRPRAFYKATLRPERITVKYTCMYIPIQNYL